MSLALSIAVVIGSIAGWLVAELVTGFGFLGGILIGSAGASIAALTFPALRLHGLGSWAVATAIGAITFPLVACFIKRLLSLARTL